MLISLVTLLKNKVTSLEFGYSRSCCTSVSVKPSDSYPFLSAHPPFLFPSFLPSSTQSTASAPFTMQHSPTSPSHPILALRGPIKWQHLHREVALLESIETPNQAMLHDTCGFLNNISKSQWNAMADVFVDIKVGRETRKVSWTKYLYQSIIDARQGPMVSLNLSRPQSMILLIPGIRARRRSISCWQLSEIIK